MLEDDGYLIVKDFLGNEKSTSLLNETKSIFNDVSNKLNGYEIIKSTKNNFTKFINFPCIAVTKNNLLEIAVDVYEKLKSEISQFEYKNYLLTNIDIQETKGKNIPMHVDDEKDMFRCFLFLKGGKKDSGSLKYIKKTHLRDYFVQHHLDDYLKKKLNQNTFDSNLAFIEVEKGDLVLMNTWGFHGSCIKKTSRIVVIFEYRSKENTTVSNHIPMVGELLTKKVKKNLLLFTSKPKGIHGSYKRMNSLPNHINPKNILKPSLKYLLRSIR